MDYQVLITERAAADLEEIVSYIAADNPDAAERVGNRLVDKTDVLATTPLFGRVVPERKDPLIRELISAPYRIVYRVDHDQRRAEVLRFWHAARGEPEL
jgi:plasmid stabilization system protein ParE